MWIPWRGKSGLAKAAAILATILSIATVSCGLNFVLVLTTMNFQAADSILLVTGWVELAAMGGSVVGLVVVLVMVAVRKSEKKNAAEDRDSR